MSSTQVAVPTKSLEIVSGLYMSKLTARMDGVGDAVIQARGGYLEEFEIFA